MDHIVYVDAKEKELEKLLSGEKKMIVRGAAGRKLPYGRVNAGDQLYFMRNNAEGLVQACAAVMRVFLFGPLATEESQQVLEQHQDQLQLTPAQLKRWAGKRYLVLVELDPVQPLAPFAIDRSAYGTMDDWLPVGQIDSVKTG